MSATQWIPRATAAWGFGSVPLLAALVAGLVSPSIVAVAQWPAADTRQYVVADALFLQRNNAAVDRALVVDATDPTQSVLSAADAQSVIGTGVRLLYGEYGTDGIGWEAGYLGVWGMDADATVGSAAGTKRRYRRSRPSAVRTVPSVTVPAGATAGRVPAYGS